MTCQQLITIMGAQPLSDGATLGAGCWYALLDRDYRIEVEAGVTASLLLCDSEAVADVEIAVGRGSVLNIVRVVTHRSVLTHDVTLDEGAECNTTELVLNAADTRTTATFIAPFARYNHNGVFILDDKEEGSVTVDVMHNVSDCTSRTNFKGVAVEQAHGSFEGTVYVAPDAQRTDSEQSSRNVVMGDARIDTLPQLEIYADDVRCSHGATVGQMDADAILYMRQRGLSLADARRLQIEGFVSDVVMRASIESLVEPLQELLAVKFNKL
ncbi:MAG: SufD family Fe-S cluster assembly protein [Alistipes sp.]|nr:SufD family Fe-S cluster assembly protein [Alistipes sp.]